MSDVFRNAAVNRIDLNNVTVTSLNGLAGAVTLISSDNTIDIAVSGQDIDLTTTAASGFVPYVGATSNVDLGAYQLKASEIISNRPNTSPATMMQFSTAGTADWEMQINNIGNLYVYNPSLSASAYFIEKASNKFNIDGELFVGNTITAGAGGQVSIDGVTSNILTVGDVSGSTINQLILSPQAAGFTISGGGTSKTLTVPLDATVSGTNTGDQTSVSGNAGTATILQTARAINGVNFNGSAAITVTAAAGTLTGTTLNSTVVTSSLTALGTQSQALNMGSHLVSNVTDPVSSTDAATKGYVDNAVIGLLDYRGGYNASSNLFPSTGGSGLLGAILKGDFWIATVAGTLGGVAVTPGDLIIAIVDTPGQTSTNWDLIPHDLGSYVTSVTGTANRITSTGGSTPSIDISATFEALLGKVASPLSQFASTTSAQLAGVISDETGSGALVFATSPTLVTPVLGVATATSINGLQLYTPTIDSGLGSVAIGTDGMGSFLLSGPYNNTATGFQAMQGAANGGTVTAAAVSNVANGYKALRSITTADTTTAIGAFTLRGLQGGSGNTGVGYGVCGNLVTASMSGSTAIGALAAFNVTGSFNTILGYSVAFNTLTTGTGNILIGCSSAIDTALGSTSNTLKIGNSSTPVISATGINGTPVVTIGGSTLTIGSNTITLAGALTTSGANPLTLTTTGSTNVTLPTTGTLVNTAVTTLSSLASVGTITTGTWNAGAVTSSGLLTSTAQPLVIAYKSAGASNVTGDFTSYQIIHDTEVIDQGNNYNNSTGVFTAPNTRSYLFVLVVNPSGLSATFNYLTTALDVNSGTEMRLTDSGAIQDTNGNALVNGSAILKLTAGDAVKTYFTAGGGTKIVGIGSGLGYSRYAIYMLP